MRTGGEAARTSDSVSAFRSAGRIGAIPTPTITRRTSPASSWCRPNLRCTWNGRAARPRRNRPPTGTTARVPARTTPMSGNARADGSTFRRGLPATDSRRTGMNAPKLRWTALGAVLLLGACATLPPSGPSVMVLPGSGKNFDQFRADDYECRNFASAQTGATPEQAQVDSGVKSAAIGTAVAAGAGAAQSSAGAMQRRYDVSYVQCMYAKGHQIPTSGRYEGQRRGYSAPPPPP